MTPSPRGRNMRAMVGHILRVGASAGLLIVVCLGEPLHAQQDAPTEPQEMPLLQARILNIYPDGILVPMRGLQVVWPRLAPSAQPPIRQISLASQRFRLSRFLSEPRKHFGPVEEGAPSHDETIAVTTPIAFRTSAVISFSVPWKSR